MQGRCGYFKFYAYRLCETEYEMRQKSGTTTAALASLLLAQLIKKQIPKPLCSN